MWLKAMKRNHIFLLIFCAFLIASNMIAVKIASEAY